MRKIDSKPEIDLQKKITVEMTLLELMELTAAKGKSNTARTKEFFDLYYGRYGGSELVKHADESKRYRTMKEILASEGIEVN